MTTLSSIRDFVTSLWPRPATTSTPTAPAAGTPTSKPGVGGAPTTFDASKAPTGPVLSPREPSDADIKKVAERVMTLIVDAGARKARAFTANDPAELKQLTRAEQKQVLDFANKHDAMMNEWAKTSPLLRGTRVMSNEELEAAFDETVFQPQFTKLIDGIATKSLQRYVDLRSTAKFLKREALPNGTAEQRALTADDLKVVANFTNLFQVKMDEWAKTTPLLRGTRVMTTDELEAHFWQHEFVPMVEQRLTERFQATTR